MSPLIQLWTDHTRNAGLLLFRRWFIIDGVTATLFGEQQNKALDLNYNGVFLNPRTPDFRVESRRSPSFLEAFLWGTPPFCLHLSEFWEYTESSDDALKRMFAPVKRIIFFVFVPRWSFFMLILNAFTHLMTLLLYSGHQFIHCMGLECVQRNVKLCCLELVC